MRTAVLDLGTNTFNILIADVAESKFTVVHSEKEGVSLGMGGINHNIISPDAYQRGLDTLRHFNFVCIHYRVEVINAFGTSALRGASNSLKFIQQVNDELGIAIKIISGEKEADLIYKGVQWSYDFEKPGMIMDIGGGSTEFIFADKHGLNHLTSLNIGVSRIIQELKLSDPLTKKDIRKINEWLDEKAGGFFDGKREELLIGASGSFETFYELVYNTKFPEDKLKCVEVPMEKLNTIIDWVIYSSQEERDLNTFIIPIRKKMAPIAAVKTKWVIEKLSIKKTIISRCSLKEGALREGDPV
jgi:exopolyphosphatase / guanosine-5'-triphosphate,3'-diphosphate pyrophosphatase